MFAFGTEDKKTVMPLLLHHLHSPVCVCVCGGAGGTAMQGRTQTYTLALTCTMTVSLCPSYELNQHNPFTLH